MEVSLEPLTFCVGSRDDPLARGLEQREPGLRVRAQPLVCERKPCRAGDLLDQGGIVEQALAVAQQRDRFWLSLQSAQGCRRPTGRGSEIEGRAVSVDEAGRLADRVGDLERGIAEHGR